MLELCLQIVMHMQNLQAASKQENSAGTRTVASTASAFSSRAEGTSVGLASAIQMSQESKHVNGIVGRTPGQELVVLPISAVEAGLLPSNQGTLRLLQYDLENDQFWNISCTLVIQSNYKVGIPD